MKIVIELTPGTSPDYVLQWVERLMDDMRLHQFEVPRGTVYNEWMKGIYPDLDTRPTDIEFVGVQIEGIPDVEE